MEFSFSLVFMHVSAGLCAETAETTARSSTSILP
jgi:hypothetical protein